MWINMQGTKHTIEVYAFFIALKLQKQNSGADARQFPPFYEIDQIFHQ